MKRCLQYISKYKWWLLLLFAVAAICCALNFSSFRTLFAPPLWIDYQDKRISFTENGYDYSLVIQGKKCGLYSSNGDRLWTSDDAYRIQDGFLTDLDGNGDLEMVLLVWKRGTYGKARPFWVKDNDNAYSQHIFIYDISDGGKVSQKWFASDIGILVSRMKLMDKNPSIILAQDRDGNNTLWSWESFGLKNIENEVSFLAFGDNIIHEPIYEYAKRYEGGSFDFLYEPFAKEIQSADIAMVQAETVLVDKTDMVSGYPSFGSPMEVGKALKKAGFDVVACANNHILDKGTYGIDVSSSFYKENGMTVIGIQESTEKEYRPYELISKNGIKIALFAYTYGTNAGDASDKYHNMIHYLPRESDAEKDAFVSEIKSARNEADFVIVYVHWGDEYETKVSDYQKEMTALLAEAGADVVIGSHPHVVQKAELVKRPDGKDMLVFYSLGNFRADQEYKGAKASFVIEHSFEGVSIEEWQQTEFEAYWKLK